MDKIEYQALTDIARKFKVYSHPLRMLILYSIYTSGNCCVHEICKKIKNDCQPIVSQHLSILKKNGIVQSKIIKNKRVYEIIDPFIISVIQDIKKEDIKKEDLKKSDNTKNTKSSIYQQNPSNSNSNCSSDTCLDDGCLEDNLGGNDTENDNKNSDTGTK